MDLVLIGLGFGGLVGCVGCLGQVLWAEWRLLGVDWLGVVVGWVLPIGGLGLVVVVVLCVCVCVCVCALLFSMLGLGVDCCVLIK